MTFHCRDLKVFRVEWQLSDTAVIPQLGYKDDYSKPKSFRVITLSSSMNSYTDNFNFKLMHFMIRGEITFLVWRLISLYCFGSFVFILVVLLGKQGFLFDPVCTNFRIGHVFFFCW